MGASLRRARDPADFEAEAGQPWARPVGVTTDGAHTRDSIVGGT